MARVRLSSAVAKSLKALLDHGDDAVPTNALARQTPRKPYGLGCGGGGIACAALARFYLSMVRRLVRGRVRLHFASYYADLFFAGRFNDRPGSTSRIRPAPPAEVSDRRLHFDSPSSHA